jgi:MYXO-CTERM domain-containing protein
VQLLLEKLGPADAVPPTVAFGDLVQGGMLTIGSIVTVNAADNVGVTKAELWIDGAFHATATFPPFDIETRRDVSVGAHSLELRADDNDGNIATAGPIDVTFLAECATDAECPDGYSCAGSVCAGDHGASCENNIDCTSGLCAPGTGPDDLICTSFCSGPSAADCPAGTSCQMSVGGGFDKCLPSAPTGCGCRTGGGESGTPAGLLALLALCGGAILARRRHTVRR